MKIMGVSLLGIMLAFTSISYAKTCQPGEAEQLIKQGWSFQEATAHCNDQTAQSPSGPGGRSGTNNSADTSWLQGTWQCTGSMQNPMMNCYSEGTTFFMGNRFETDLIHTCGGMGTMQMRIWGRYVANGRGESWAIIFYPEGSAPPSFPFQETTFYKVNPGRTMMTTSQQMGDGNFGMGMSRENQCQKTDEGSP